MEPPVLLTFIASQALGIAAVGCLFAGDFSGYRSSTSKGQSVPAVRLRFMFHPSLMAAGLTFLIGLASVAFRVFRGIDRASVKHFHVAIQTAALAVALTGVIFAVQSKESKGLNHFQTIHGLIGIITVILFVVQWLVSVPVFLWPKASGSLRAPGIKIHVCLGVGVFLCGAVATFTGLGKHGGDTKEAANYYKSSAILYLLYTLSIMFMVSLNRYKRPPD